MRNKPTEVEPVLGRIADPATPLPKTTREALLVAFGDGLLRTGKTLQALKMPAGSPPRALFDSLVADASNVAANPAATVPARVRALQLLAHAEFATGKPAFEAGLDPRQPQELQLAAIRALRATADTGAPAVLFARWASFTPAVRGEVISTLSGRPAWTAALLDAVEAGTVARSQIDSTRQAALKNHRDPKVRDRAAKLFAAATSATRQQAIDRYKGAAEKPGAGEGAARYSAAVRGCHVAGTIGGRTSGRHCVDWVKTAQELLVSVFDPNREVDPRYLNYTVT